MATGTNYKSLYEETKQALKIMEQKYQKCVRSFLSDKELLALKAVAYGCNINRELSRGANATFKSADEAIPFAQAILVVYDIIERFEKNDNK